MTARTSIVLTLALMVGALSTPPALGQGMEESAEPTAQERDSADGGSGLNSEGASRSGGEVDEPDPATPALQGNVSRTAPLALPPPQNYTPPSNFGYSNGFAPGNGYAPQNVFPQGPPPTYQPYQPNFVPPQAPPGSFGAGTAQADKSPDSPKGGLFGGVFKSFMNGAVKQNNTPPAERPWWIPGNAFTNESMVAPYHAMDIFWWDKRPIPNKPQMVRLSTSVSRFWRGYVAEPCFVLVEPDPRAPGNFTFKSRQPGGPRGWLQALDKPDPSGFPQYRYWLDQ
ncbi:hypothetical protein KF707_19115 [Candidatus Obscuribacterales bacterium]|nr:hypothetical protein [Candidatus Obscuribacterales bacterium]MBX3148743.1 hypothetical protein [Candidatus Obscuribacterales bacterium]